MRKDISQTQLTCTLIQHTYNDSDIYGSIRNPTRYEAGRPAGFDAGFLLRSQLTRLTTVGSTPARFEARQIFGKHVTTASKRVDGFEAGRLVSKPVSGCELVANILYIRFHFISNVYTHVSYEVMMAVLVW